MHFLLLLLGLQVSHALPGLTTKGLKKIDAMNCSAGGVLMDVYKQNGIDVTQGKANYQWRCKGNTARTSSANRCPYPQYSDLPGHELHCYSDTKDGPAVCLGKGVSSSRSIKNPDGTRTRVKVPRFQELHVLNKGSNGHRNDTNYKMDSDGCNVSSVWGEAYVGISGGTFTASFEDCRQKYANMLNGGPFFQGDKVGSKNSFCTKEKPESYARSYAHALKDISACFQHFPNFLGRFQEAKTVTAAPATKRKRSTNR